MKSGIKQAELAEKIMVSQSSLSGYENGKFEPDSKTLLKIANFFHVSVDYILGGDVFLPKEKFLMKVPVYKSVLHFGQKPDPLFFYYQEMDPSCSQTNDYFGLYMDKDFLEPRICTGDLLIARRQSEVPNGSIAVIQTGRDKVVVKKVWKMAGDEIMLLSFNPKYEPDVYTYEQASSLPVRILGLVVEFHAKITLG